MKVYVCSGHFCCDGNIADIVRTFDSKEKAKKFFDDFVKGEKEGEWYKKNVKEKENYYEEDDDCIEFLARSHYDYESFDHVKLEAVEME